MAFQPREELNAPKPVNGDGFKPILICEVKDGAAEGDLSNMRLHVLTNNEAMLALGLRKLSQAIDWHMAQLMRKQQAGGIVKAPPGIMDRIRGI